MCLHDSHPQHLRVTVMRTSKGLQDMQVAIYNDFVKLLRAGQGNLPLIVSDV